MHANSLQSCLTLCDPMDCSPPGSSVQQDFPGKNTGVGCHGDLPGPGIKPTSLMSPALIRRFFTTSTTLEACCGLLVAFIYIWILSHMPSIILNLKMTQRKKWYIEKASLLCGSLFPSISAPSALTTLVILNFVFHLLDIISLSKVLNYFQFFTLNPAQFMSWPMPCREEQWRKLNFPWYVFLLRILDHYIMAALVALWSIYLTFCILSRFYSCSQWG